MLSKIECAVKILLEERCNELAPICGENWCTLSDSDNWRSADMHCEHAYRCRRNRRFYEQMKTILNEW